MLNKNQKIEILEKYLSEVHDNYGDSFKTDILFYFDEFTIDNPKLLFLNQFETEKEVLQWVDSLISQIILKFDSECEQLTDFIFEATCIIK